MPECGESDACTAEVPLAGAGPGLHTRRAGLSEAPGDTDLTEGPRRRAGDACGQRYLLPPGDGWPLTLGLSLEVPVRESSYSDTIANLLSQGNLNSLRRAALLSRGPRAAC